MAAPGAEMSAELKLRVAAAAVLAPAVLLLAWLGGWALALLVAAAAVVMAREWQGLIADSSAPVVAAAALAAVALAMLGRPLLALAVLALAALVLACDRRGAVRSALGPLYVGVPCVALLWLRQQPDHGLALVIWLLLVVWATDIGAYAVGRLVGGPRLAPRISPAKTWAGLGGGMLAAAAVGGIAAIALGWTRSLAPALTGAALAVVAQAGDLFESWLKRRRGLKDSGVLIPGHGGLLDRVDGLMTATPALALLILFAGDEGLSW